MYNWEAWFVDCWHMCVLCRELLNCNWKSRDKEKLAPNVSRLIRRTNEVRRRHLVTMVARFLTKGDQTVDLGYYLHV